MIRDGIIRPVQKVIQKYTSKTNYQSNSLGDTRLREQLSSPSLKRITLAWTQAGRTMMKEAAHTNRLIRIVLDLVLRLNRRNGWTRARYLEHINEWTIQILPLLCIFSDKNWSFYHLISCLTSMRSEMFNLKMFPVHHYCVGEDTIWHLQ